MKKMRQKIIWTSLVVFLTGWVLHALLDYTMSPHIPLVNHFFLITSLGETMERLITMVTIAFFLAVLFKVMGDHWEAMRQSEKKYRDLYDFLNHTINNVPDLIWAKDLDGRFTLVNRAMCQKLLQCASPEEAHGRTDQDFAQREKDAGHDYTFVDICINSDAVIKETQQPGRFLESGLVRGEPLILDVFKAPLFDDAGRLVGTVGCGRDATQEQAMATALKESEEKYRLLINNIPAVAFKGYTDWGIEFFDGKVEELTGYSPAEFVDHGRKWSDLILPEDLPGAREAFRQALETTRRYVREYRIRHKDGQIMWLQSRGQIICDAQGQVQHISGVFFDITPQKQMEAALRKNEQFLEDIFAGIQDGLSILDNEMNILRVNAAMARFPHTKPMVGRKCHEVYHGRREPCHPCPCQRTLASGEASHEVVTNQTHEGVLLYVEIFSYPLWDRETGELKGVIEYVRDVTQLKEAELALVRSENQYRTLVENMPAITYTAALDQNSTTNYVSPQVEAILGYSPADYEADPDLWNKLLHPEDREWVMPAVHRTHSELAPFSMEYRMIARDGRTVWFQDEARVVRDESGQPDCLQGVMLDITAKKEAEEELQRHSALMEGISRIFQEAMVSHSEEALGRTFLDVAEGLTGSQFGFTGNLNAWGTLDTTAISDPGWTGWTMADGSRLRLLRNLRLDNLFGLALRERQPVLTNDPGSHTAGTGSPFCQPPINAFLGAPLMQGADTLGMIGLANKPGGYTDKDLESVTRLSEAMVEATLHRRARQALADSERRYRLLAENVNDVIWTADLEGRTTYISPSVFQMRGYTPEEAMMQTFADILTPASLEMALQRLGEEISREGREPGSGGQPTTLEVEVYRKDGSTVWTEVQASFLRDAMGRAVGLLGVSRDITQRRLLEDQLRHAQRLEVVGRLAGGVAHDFNNLLMAILGYNDLLLGGLSPNSTLYFYAREIRKAGERAADLTRQLLSFSRRQALLPQAVDLNQLLGNLRPMLERLLGEHTSLTFQPDPALWQVLVDAGEMEQVILNLVVNARDAMPQGGRLAITTANVSLNQDYVRIHADVQPGDYVRLTVQDSGGGMTPEVMNRIFEPFFTTKDVGQGTGLGLSMVYGTVRQSQGYIQVSSAPGQGARFEVFLPRMTPPGAAAPTPAAPPAPDPAAALRGRETILLVEDEEMVRTLAAMALRGQGYTVVEAANGRQAQDMFEADPASIALLITDVAMPGEDGWELAQRLISQAPGLKVIVMSGYAEAARAAALAAGPPVVYLEKPFDSMTLLSKVRELLDQKD